jgi:alkylation response protein AidB-like acyl-CoA dehydrogenase
VNQGDELVEIDAFRTEARRWLAENMTARVSAEDHGTSGDEREAVARAKSLQERLFEGNFAGLSFPKEYGGQGLTALHQQAFDEESAGYEMPTILRVPTLTIIGPTLLACGSSAQKERYLPPLLHGHEWWVQLLSEPTGGSDLAGVITRGVRDGDVLILNGQKVWSTGAHYSDFGLALVRTNAEAPKHRGLTMVIVPFGAPGVTVKQIKQITGEADFCEVFFDDVQVHVDNVVGEINEGWSVASTLMGFERRAAGVGRPRDVVADLLRLSEQREEPLTGNVDRLIADTHVSAVVESYLARRVTQAVQLGVMPPQASALLKLYRAAKVQAGTEAALEILGTQGVVWDPQDPSGGDWAQEYLGSRARSIAGGTNEMQRNVIGDRLLGLPREPQAAANVPFNQILQNRVPDRFRRDDPQ